MRPRLCIEIAIMLNLPRIPSILSLLLSFRLLLPCGHLAAVLRLVATEIFSGFCRPHVGPAAFARAVVHFHVALGELQPEVRVHVGDGAVEGGEGGSEDGEVENESGMISGG